MRINTNTAAMNTYSNLTSANASKSGSLAKLSSGLRINKAGDDAAGLSISEKMKSQISGMTQASRNAQDGISLIQTAEGALTETHSMLNRMRDLTVQAGNDTNTADDKKAIQGEIDSLTAEITRVADDTQFNTKGLLNGKIVTETSLGDADKVDALTVAYNKDYGTAKGGTDVSGKADLAKALNKLTETELEGVIDTYNTTETTEVNVLDDDFKTSNAYDEAKFTDNKVAEAALLKYQDTDADATMNSFVTDLKGGTVTEALSALSDAISSYNTAIKPTTPTDIKANDIQVADKTTFTFQIGANAGEKIGVTINNMSAKGLNIADINVNDDSQTTDDILGKLDKAISDVSSQRADLGATQNRLDHTVSNLATTKENLSEANSRITDVDMAEEMMSFTKSNILAQASTSMLAQANQMPQSVLSLLQ